MYIVKVKLEDDFLVMIEAGQPMEFSTLQYAQECVDQIFSGAPADRLGDLFEVYGTWDNWNPSECEILRLEHVQTCKVRLCESAV
jgi:hypothetical protein